MSYDLMVFDPQSAPKKKQDFKKWYRQFMKWEEGHKYDDPDITTEALKNWFMDMIKDFPAMDGKFAISEDDERFDDSETTGYSIGKHAIYTDFRWSVAEKAYDTMFRTAKKHNVGFYDVSGSGKVYVPDSFGNYHELQDNE